MDHAWGSTAAGVTSPRPRPSATDSSHRHTPALGPSRRSDPTISAGAPRRQHGRSPVGPRRGSDARGFAGLAAAVSTGSVAATTASWQGAQIPMSPPQGAGTTRTAGASKHCSQRCPGRGVGAGEAYTSRTSAMRRGRRRRARGVPAPGSSPGLPSTLRWIILPRPPVR